MSGVQVSPAPDTAFTNDYTHRGDYTDCYSLVVKRHVSLVDFIRAFYTTPVFKLERLILAAVGRPSSDADAEALAAGQSESFAAWTVESRVEDQVLLAAGRTRSWLMVQPEQNLNAATRLYFGSAIVMNDRGELGWSFKAALAFHKVYSRVLLRAAASRLTRG